MKSQSSKYALFALLFLCFAGAILGDSTAEALLLANFPSSLVPRMYLFNALFLFVASAFIMPVIDRVNRAKFFLGYAMIHGCVLMVAWLAVLSGMSFLFVPLFSYAYVSKILLFLLFWTLANDLTDSRKAGREFPFIAAGGTLGAIAISFAIPGLLRLVEASNLLPIWACLSILSGIFFAPIARKHAYAFSAGKKHLNADNLARLKTVGSDVKLLWNQPLLRTISILYFLLFVLLLSQQFTFYQAIRGRYEEAGQLAAFLGYFNGFSMAATFLLQMTVSGRLIRAIGSTRSMFVLPAALCIVFGLLLVIGAFIDSPHSLVLFWAIIIGVAVRIAFFDSFFSPNFQVFFSSLPHEIRGRAKLAVEGAVKPAAIGMASLWLMFAPACLPFPFLMAVYLGGSGIMIFLVFRLRKDYTRSLTQFLAGFNLKRKKSVLNIDQLAKAENIYHALDEILRTESFETAGVVVETLAQMNSPESLAILKEHIGRATPHLRSRIVSALTPLRREELKPLFRSLLADSDCRVVANAVLALAEYRDYKVNSGLGIFANHRNNRVRANALVALWENSRYIKRGYYEQTLKAMLASDDKKENSSGLYVLSELKLGDFAKDLLLRFFSDRRKQILSDRQVWSWYLRAVAHNIGEQLLDDLENVIEGCSQRRRGDIARMFCTIIASGYSIDTYVDRVQRSGGVVREIYLQGLFLARRGGYLSRQEVDFTALVSIAKQQCREIYQAWHALRVIGQGTDSAIQLFGYAIREVFIERKILALQFIAAVLDKTGQISSILHQLNHENSHVRARALEVLDNTGNSKVNRWLLELLDSPDSRLYMHNAHAMGIMEFSDISRVVSHYGKESDKWIQICAAYVQKNNSPVEENAGITNVRNEVRDA
ncbi:MAG: hypothetical protein ACLFSB_13910 [Chitinispirillaceae bacterium]